MIGWTYSVIALTVISRTLDAKPHKWTYTIGVASYGALGHVPPLDFQLVILGITRFTDSDESRARFSVQ